MKNNLEIISVDLVFFQRTSRRKESKREPSETLFQTILINF